MTKDEGDYWKKECEGARACAWREIHKLEAENARLKAAIASLHDAIKHGDDNHQNWLKAALDDRFRAALAAPQTGGDDV